MRVPNYISWLDAPVVGQRALTCEKTTKATIPSTNVRTVYITSHANTHSYAAACDRPATERYIYISRCSRWCMRSFASLDANLDLDQYQHGRPEALHQPATLPPPHTTLQHQPQHKTIPTGEKLFGDAVGALLPLRAASRAASLPPVALFRLPIPTPSRSPYPPSPSCSGRRRPLERPADGAHKVRLVYCLR